MTEDKAISGRIMAALIAAFAPVPGVQMVKIVFTADERDCYPREYGIEVAPNGDVLRIENWNNEEVVSLSELAADYCESLDLHGLTEEQETEVTLQMLRREVRKAVSK